MTTTNSPENESNQEKANTDSATKNVVTDKKELESSDKKVTVTKNVDKKAGQEEETSQHLDNKSQINFPASFDSSSASQMADDNSLRENEVRNVYNVNTYNQNPCPMSSFDLDRARILGWPIPYDLFNSYPKIFP